MPLEEFMEYYQKAKTINKRDTELVCVDYTSFLRINQKEEALKRYKDVRKRPADSKKPPADTKKNPSTVSSSKKPKLRQKHVFVFDIEDSFVYLDSFLPPNAPEKIRRVAQVLEDAIIRVATRLFFYKDLKKLEQPMIDYLSAFDDGQDLGRYDFERDRLVARKPSPVDPEFGRERAYRCRVMKQRYTGASVSGEFGPDFARQLEEDLEYFDEKLKGLNSLAKAIFTIISKQSDSEIYLIAPRSMPRLLSQCFCFGLAQCIPAERIYNSMQFGRHWCLSDIKARLEGRGNAGAKYVLCGGHRACEEDAKRLGFEFFRVRGKTDMMAFAQHFDLVLL